MVNKELKKDFSQQHQNSLDFSKGLKELMLKCGVDHITVNQYGESIDFIGDECYVDLNATETGYITIKEIDNSIAYYNHFVEDNKQNNE